MPSLDDIIKVTGASRRDIENWVGRLPMTSHFEPTVRGRSRVFSRDNVLELALIAAFVRAGLPPSRAVAFARPFVQWDPTPRPDEEWLVLAAGNETRAVPVADASDMGEIRKHFGDVVPAVFTFVAIGEARRRVDRLFGLEV